MGFEPTVQFPVHSISSAASSATPAPLRRFGISVCRFATADFRFQFGICRFSITTSITRYKTATTNPKRLLVARSKSEIANGPRQIAKCQNRKSPIRDRKSESQIGNRKSAVANRKSQAERVGFEPTVPVRAQRFSRPPDSTTLAPLRTLAISPFTKKRL